MRLFTFSPPVGLCLQQKKATIFSFLLLFVGLLLSSMPAYGQRYYTALGVPNAQWNSPGSWTLNANGGGQTLSGSGLITQGPGAGAGTGTAQDTAVVLEGATITLTPATIRTVRRVEIRQGGRLVIAAGSNVAHTFTNLTGTGTLVFEAAATPALVVTNSPTSFMASSGGTIEYAATTGFTVPPTLFGLNYNNLTLSGGGTKIINSNLTTNGSVTVAGATSLQVNNAAAARTWNIGRDFTITSTAANAVTLGAFDTAPHQINISGNYLHADGAGNVEWTLQIAQSNAVDPGVAAAVLNFVNDNIDQTFTANAVGEYFRIYVDKGIDKTYKLTMTGDDPANIAIYGPLTECGGGDANQGDQTCVNGIGIAAGTLEVGPGVNLSVSSTNYDIDTDAQIWVNGGVFNSPGPMAIYGTFLISSGRAYATGDASIAIRNNGIVQVENSGYLYADLIRLSLNGATTNRPTVIVTGGRIDLGQADQVTVPTPSFDLNDPSTVFIMSGGEINVFPGGGDPGFWRVTTNASNTFVSGGTVRFFIDNDAENNNVSATNSFWDVEIIRRANSSQALNIASGAITVQNNLTLIDSSRATTNLYTFGAGESLTVGRNLILRSPSTGSNPHVDWAAGNLNFIGQERSRFTIDSTAYAVAVRNLTINKSSDTSTVEFRSPGRANLADFLTVGASGQPTYILTVTRGRLDYGAFSLNLLSTLTISNSTRIGTSTGAGRLHLNGAAQTLNLSEASTISIGRLRVTGNTKTFAGGGIDSVYTLEMNGALVDMGNYGVYVHDAITPVVAYAATNALRGAGDAGDVGLSIRLTGTGAVNQVFPIARDVAGTRYNPATANLNFPTLGSIVLNVRSQDGPLATARRGDPGSPLDSMVQNFWRVRYTQLSGTTPNVTSLSFVYVDADITGAQEAFYIPGKIVGTTRTSVGTVADVVEATNTINFTTGFTTIENADYTAGNAFRFTGDVLIFYSRNDRAAWIEGGPQTGPGNGADLDDATIWSNISHASTTPAPRAPADGDIIQIADAHRVQLTTEARNFAEVRVAGPNGYLMFESNNGETGSNLGDVSGDGQILVLLQGATATFALPAGDYSSFNLNNGIYKLLAVDVPAGGYIMPNSLTTFPNLVIEGVNGAFNDRQINMPTVPITVNRTLQVRRGVTAYVRNNVTINDSLVIGDHFDNTFPPLAYGPVLSNARMLLPNSATAATVAVTVGRKLTIVRGTAVNQTRLEVENGGTTTGPHTLTVNGDIELQTGAFFDLDADIMRGTLVMGGATNATVSGGTANPVVATNLTINKGTSTSTTLDFVLPLQLNGAADGATKPLTLSNGLFRYNPGSAQTLVLSTGGANFTIAGSAGLWLSNNVSATILNTGTGSSGITLDGALTLRGNSTLTMVGGTGEASSIEYTASGKSRLDFGGGNVLVSGQIRRSGSNSGGSLQYVQTSGNVYLGTGISTVAQTTVASNRATLDIENNPGSSFTFTGGNLIVSRRRTQGTTPDLQLNVTIPDGQLNALATIQIGNEAVSNATGIAGTADDILATPIAQRLIRMQTPKFPSLLISGGAVGTIAQQQVVDLTVNGNVTITAADTLNMNGRNLFVKGNFTNNGTYIGNATTTLNGTTAQVLQLDGTTTINNLTLNNTAGTSISSTSTETTLNLSGNLSVLNGTFNLTDNTVVVGNNLVVDAATSGTGTIRMVKNTLPVATISGTGTRLIENLTISTLAGVDMTSAMNINGILAFDTGLSAGVLNIGNNRLTFTANAGAVTGANNGRFIQTSGSTSAEGVAKQFAASPSGVVFNLPFGSSGKYTPATYTVTGTGSPFLRVRPVDGKNLATQGANVTPTPINRALQYYWTVAEANGTFTVLQQQYVYLNSDVPGGDESDYEGGYINPSLNSWVTTGPTGINTTTNTITFTNITEIESDYTAGIAPEELGAILTLYSSGATTVFNTQNAWWITPTGPTNPTNPPSPSFVGGAARLVIQNGHTIVADADNLQAFSVEICPTCTLDVSNRVGQVYNTITGSGTLLLRPEAGASTANLPTADYTAFTGTNGGTLLLGSFGADAPNYAVPASFPSVWNLGITGAGTRALTSNIVVNNNYVQTGAAVNLAGFTMAIADSFTHTTAGTFDGTTGTVVFNGTAQQRVEARSTTGTQFFNVTLNNAAGLLIAPAGGDMIVNGVFTFTNGSVTSNTSATNPNATAALFFGTNGTYTGANASRRVIGWVQKQMAAGGSFQFPVGVTGYANKPFRAIGVENTQATDVWSARFFGTPFSGSIAGSGANEFARAVEEHWLVDYAATAGTNSANIRTTWGADNPLTTDVAGLRVAGYDGTDDNWDLVASSLEGGSTATSGSVVSNARFPMPAGERYFAVGSVLASLPVEWLSFTGRYVAGGVQLNWSTSTETNNEYFEVERSFDGATWTAINPRVSGAGNSLTVQRYQLLDPEVRPGFVYYRIRQVDFDGVFTYSPILELNQSGPVNRGDVWSVRPNPSVGDDFEIVVISPDVDPLDVHVAQLIGSNGNLVLRIRGNLVEVGSALRNSLTNSGSGLYFLKVASGNSGQMFRIIRN